MYKEPTIVKTILQNKNKIEGLTFTYLKKYYKTTVIKNSDIGPAILIDQWNIPQNSETNPYICGYLIYAKNGIEGNGKGWSFE